MITLGPGTVTGYFKLVMERGYLLSIFSRVAVFVFNKRVEPTNTATGIL
jgi:hypothetical protein